MRVMSRDFDPGCFQTTLYQRVKCKCQNYEFDTVYTIVEIAMDVRFDCEPVPLQGGITLARSTTTR